MNKDKDELESKKGMSRRGFLKAGGFAVGAAVLAGGGAAGLTGCSNSNSADGSKGTPLEQAYTTFDTDILFIGSGLGALSAGFEAIKNNQKITIIDKGPFRASGATGMNWDVDYVWYPPDANGKYMANTKRDSALGRITNKKALQNSMLKDPNRNAFEFFGNKGGECFPRRNADGSAKLAMNYPFIKMVEGGFPRHHQDELSKSPLVTVYDRTMVTDFLVNQGKCIGAMALHLPTGKFRVYRAKVVIMAPGANCWINGWNTVAANSMNVPDNTSDMEIAAYRHGAKIGDSEYGQYDLISIYPTGIAYSFNAGIGADANESEFITDGKGAHFLQENFTAEEQTRFKTDRPFFNQKIGAHIAAGNGSPNGGLYLDIADPTVLPKIRLVYSRSVSLWKDSFGIDVTAPGTKLELGLEMYEHGGAPVIDENMMTDIPGLFCVRGAGVTGAGGGTAQYLNARMGSYTLRCALDYLKTATTPATMDFTSATSEFGRISEMLTRNVSGGLRPHVVRQRIQKACGTCMSVVRETAKLEAAAAELARIRKEDLPKQTCVDKSMIYNTEWKMAIENYNMLEIAEMGVKATLMRKESRGHYRPDYPTQDDANWACMITAKLDATGTMTFDKLTFPEISWDGIDF